MLVKFRGLLIYYFLPVAPVMEFILIWNNRADPFGGDWSLLLVNSHLLNWF